mmetsp:Transcript_50694/g.130749  ORF Transcript_50694/g.130749 Transcript_50694/m.130749 type:complete len:356 (-) Transcript_50694:860-1927(-)
MAESLSETLGQDRSATQECMGPWDFEKVCILGKGYLGRVYLVKKRNTGEYFAMKLFVKEVLLERNRVGRVQKERDVLVAVDHPLLLRLRWVFQTKARVYFVLDLCLGGEFFRMLQKCPQKRLPEEDLRFYACQIMCALEYLHSKGIVYRDLKPENIFIHDSGHIVLGDFDMSTMGSPPGYTAERTGFKKKQFKFPILKTLEPRIEENVATEKVGTAEYLAPEVVRGDKQTAAVDWWGLGILLFEAAVGQSPFKARFDESIDDNILRKDIDFPPDCRVSPAFRSLVQGLLQKNPSQRLGSRNGASEIKEHAFFKNVNWALVRSLRPPFIPELRSGDDIRYFSCMEDIQYRYVRDCY